MLFPPARPVNILRAMQATIVYILAAGWQNGFALRALEAFSEFPGPARRARLPPSVVLMK
jgi:hypothetical protein